MGLGPNGAAIRICRSSQSPNRLRQVPEPVPDRIKVFQTTLESRARPRLFVPSPAARLVFVRAVAPPSHFYCYLYRSIGEAFRWPADPVADLSALNKRLAREDRHLYVLYAEGVPAGFADVDYADWPTAAIEFFGIMPEFVGRGYGQFMLAQTLGVIWSRGPDALRVRASQHDHPAVFVLYQKFGFEPVGQEEVLIEPLL